MTVNLNAATLRALGELSTRSIASINYDTAITWAGRALASFQLFQETGDLGRLMDAESFLDEALEHAALSGDMALLSEIRVPLYAASESARDAARMYMTRR